MGMSGVSKPYSRLDFQPTSITFQLATWNALRLFRVGQLKTKNGLRYLKMVLFYGINHYVRHSWNKKTTVWGPKEDLHVHLLRCQANALA